MNAETKQLQSYKSVSVIAAFSALLLCFFSNCAHKTFLKTIPSEASVYELEGKGEKKKFLGKTPLDLSSSGMKKLNTLLVEKDNFESQVLVVPKVSQAEIQIQLNLIKIDENRIYGTMGRHLSSTLNKRITEMFLLRTAVYEKNTSEVEKLEKSMSKDFENISMYHTLIGYWNFSKGNKKEAQKRFEQALALDPLNSDAQSLLRILVKGQN